MIFVTGPAFSGKRDYVQKTLGLAPEACAFEVQELAENYKTTQDLQALADELCQKSAVTASEVGGGVVPMEPARRAARENAGHLAQLLAARAEKTVRLWCGIAEELT